LISFLVAFLIFFFVLRWTGWQELRNAFGLFLSYKGLILVLVTLLIWLSGTYKWKLILKDQGYDFPFSKLIQIYFAGFAVTFLTPIALVGGEGFRAYALNNQFDIPWGKNIAILTVEKILSIIVLSLFLFFGLISFLFLTSLHIKYLEILLIGLFFLFIGLLFFLHFRLYKKENITKFIFKIFGIKNDHLLYNFTHDVFALFQPKKMMFWKICLVSFSRYVFVFLRIWLLFFFLTKFQNPLFSLALMFFMYLSYLLPLPAGIGSLEAAQSIGFSYLGFEAAMGVTFSVIIRSAELFVAAFGIILLFKLGIFIFFNIIKDNIFNEKQIK